MSVANKGSIGATVTVSIYPDRSGMFVCDGVADDVQIQNAINYAGALGGGDVYIGRGTYEITAALTDNNVDDINIHGSGMYSTILKLGNAANVNIFTLTDVTGWRIADMELDGFAANQTGDINGIRTDASCHDAIFERLYIHDINGTTVNNGHGIHIEDSDRCIIRACRIEDIDYRGIMVNSCNYTKIVDCHFDGTGYEAITIGKWSTPNCDYTTVRDCTVGDWGSASAVAALHAYTLAHYTKFIGCEIYGSGGNGSDQLAIEIGNYGTDADHADHVKVIGCHVNPAGGVSHQICVADESTHCLIQGCTFMGDAGNDIVKVQDGAEYFIIADCHVETSSGNLAISVDSGGNNGMFDGNVLSGSGTNSVDDNGTGNTQGDLEGSYI